MLRVIGKIRRLKTSGYAVIMTTHLPEQAFLCDANVALLHRDGPLLFGPASGVVTERNLTQVYGVRIKIVEYLDTRNRPVRLCSPVLEP
jgi:iron complex transport system ATP-binding protein